MLNIPSSEREKEDIEIYESRILFVARSLRNQIISKMKDRFASYFHDQRVNKILGKM